MMGHPFLHREEQKNISDQDTLELPVMQNEQPGTSVKWLRILPTFVQVLLTALIVHVSDSAPETYVSHSKLPVSSRAGSLGWIPQVCLISASGLILIAFAFANSRDGGPYLAILFYPGLLLIFSPVVIRLLSPVTPRIERVVLLSLTGIYCYLVKILSSPLYFSFYDEFLHLRSANDIAQSGHLFNVNTLLPVSPYYPGLEIVTNAFTSLSGLDTFMSGLIVIGIARLLMILALFALYEQVIKSARIAGIAVIIYITNTHFISFDAQYGYESLAIPLTIVILFLLLLYQKIAVRNARLTHLSSFVRFVKGSSNGFNNDLRGLAIVTSIVLVALVVTHHVTDFFLDGLLILWMAIGAVKRLGFDFDRNLARVTLIGSCLSLANMLRPGNTVVGYLTSFINDALVELGGVITGSGRARQLFVTYAGPPTPVWERIIMAASFGLVMICLPFGLLCLWKRYRFNALLVTFGVLTIFFPIVQLFRFTTQGAELVDRSAPFLYVAIAAILAIFIVQFWPIRQLDWKRITLLTCGISLVFLGGVIQATGPGGALLPGPYEAIAGLRSIEPEGINAATWAGLYLDANNRTATDRINQILMGTYGDQNILTSVEYKIELSPVFLNAQLGPQEITLLRQADVRYLVIDLRLTKELPLEGYYYEPFEKGAYQHTTPIDPEAFAKFNKVSDINRVFDSGDIIIYDVGGIVNGT
jgi:hypothetical protein